MDAIMARIRVEMTEIKMMEVTTTKEWITLRRKKEIAMIKMTPSKSKVTINTTKTASAKRANIVIVLVTRFLLSIEICLV
jgi:hypothetical protein